MICDAHIHIGPFRDRYFPPGEVYAFLRSVGVSRFAVSSTTTCTDNCHWILYEMMDILHLGGKAITPVLWITPKMLIDGGLDQCLNSGIDWRCLKVHGYFDDWHTDSRLLQQVVSLARQMQVPMLFHTGGREESDAVAYHGLIHSNPDVRFILAHSRPIEQTIQILQDCPNCYADTAFTPIEAVRQMIDSGFEDRVLFGTDYPLPNVFYPEQDMVEYYNKVVDTMQQVMSSEAWEKVSYLNYEKLFG